MLFEYCAENFTNIEAALRAGADRIELCDNPVSYTHLSEQDVVFGIEDRVRCGNLDGAQVLPVMGIDRCV